MSTNGNGSAKPTAEELKRLAKAPSQPQQPLITESEFTPEEARTPRPLSGNPVLKIALVSGLLLPVFGVAGLILNGNHPSQPQKETTQAKAPEAQAAPETSDAATVAKQREELGQTQAELAIAQQRQALKNQTNPKQSPTPKIKTEPQKVAVQPSARVNPPVSPRPVVAPVPVSDVPAPRIIRPPAVRSIAPPALPRVEPVVATKPPATAESASPQDNYDRYLALTQLGSYGQMPTEEVPQKRAAPTEAPTATAYQTARDDKPEPVVSETAEETAILNEQPQQALLASTKVAGILTTPVVADEKSADAVLDDHFTIELTQPLKTDDGAIAIPARSQLITQLKSISESGLVKLQVVSAIVDQDGQSAEIQLPAGAIQIRGKAGQPLIAKHYGDKGKTIASMDMGTFALGALNKASELFTRPQSSSVVSSNGSVIASTQNSKPNVLAGVLQGGSQALLSTIAQRNRQAMQALSAKRNSAGTAQQPEIRFLPAGSEVEVFVNRSMPIPTELITAMAPPSLPSERSSLEEAPILAAPTQVPIQEGSTLPHAETFSGNQSSLNDALPTTVCGDGNTCENSLNDASTGQDEQLTDDSSLGRVGNEPQLPADWGTDSTSLAR